MKVIRTIAAFAVLQAVSHLIASPTALSLSSETMNRVSVFCALGTRLINGVKAGNRRGTGSETSLTEAWPCAHGL